MLRRASVILLLLTAVAGGQQPVSKKTLNGEWTGTLVLDNSSPRVALVFQLTDTSFVGKVYADATFMGDMERGSVAGDTVHFKVGVYDFTGVVSGARMKVDLIVFNGTTKQVTFTKTFDMPAKPRAVP